MTTAHAAGGRQFSVLPLAATLAIHVLLAWWWLSSTARRPVDDVAPQFVSVLLNLPQPVRPPRAEPPAPVTPQPSRERAGSPAPAAAREVPASAIPPAAAAAAPVDDPLAAPHSPETDQFVSNARKQAGAIDRELRAGKSGVPREANTPWSRFQHSVAGAYIDKSKRTVMQTYTAPDGVITYRYRQGGKVWCRKSGSVEPDMIGRSDAARNMGHFSRGNGTRAGGVDCPPGDLGWRSP